MLKLMRTVLAIVNSDRRTLCAPLLLSRILFFTVTGTRLALAQPEHTQVTVDAGTLDGVVDTGGVKAYLGIPFAKAPVGQLRWQPPQPPVPWKGIRETKNFGANCIQEHHTFGPYTAEFIPQGDFSEDCLFLNVWTPAAGPNKKFPVMIFIHGGGFIGGSGSVAIYNGRELAKKGVAVVTFNYRVGPLGFLVHPALTEESRHHSSGNYGLLDQIAALQWVRKNIHAFGGDPDNVTIFGQSAGAVSVACLMDSPLAQGLFNRAIAESGPGILPRNVRGDQSLVIREQQGARYATFLGAKSLADLRALPSGEFIKSGSEGGVPWPEGPVNDGWVLTGKPLPQKTPLIVGLNAGDTAVIDYYQPQGPPTLQGFQTAAQSKFGTAAAEFLKLYAVTKEEDVPAARASATLDEARVSVDLWATQRLSTSGTVYTYFFDRPTPWPEHPQFGAFHTAEVPYVFNDLKTVDHPWTDLDYRLSDIMSSYWSNFATNGNPNAPGLPEWPAFNPQAHMTMEFGEKVGPIPHSNLKKATFLLNHMKAVD